MVRAFIAILILASASQLSWGQSLEDAVNSPERTAAFQQRDRYRHPTQTLSFFGLSSEQTVVEIWPGGGWYTEILAPYLKENGRLYAAHFPVETDIPYFINARNNFSDKLASSPELYGNVILAEFDPGASILSVPEGSADLVLTFRNVHNWLRNDSEATAFELFFRALKPGGMLGVVEHRVKEGKSREWMLSNGYMTEQTVMDLASAAGFLLAEKSEINTNAKDSADHPKGVWTLPPSLRLGEAELERYKAIGESDRMTLLFKKPEH